MYDFDLRPVVCGLIIIGAVAGATCMGVATCVARKASQYEIRFEKRPAPASSGSDAAKGGG